MAKTPTSEREVMGVRTRSAALCTASATRTSPSLPSGWTACASTRGSYEVSSPKLEGPAVPVSFIAPSTGRAAGW